MAIAQRIKEARMAAELTQEELAKALDLATITIRQYEAGKREPKLDAIKRLATVLGVEPAWLMDVEPRKNVLFLQHNKDLGVWEEYREPYITVECETEADFEELKAALDHYHAEAAWLIDGAWAECSNCHEAEKIEEMNHKDYCPACGARMVVK